MPIIRIDLHMHSTASDGNFTPSEVVSLALQHRLDVIALTDHDTSDGVAEAQAAARDTALTVLPGVELATIQPDGETIDLLGYLYDLVDTTMQRKLLEIRDVRRGRAARIVEKLTALGAPISLDRVFEIAGSGSVGRPHIAQAMLEAGYVATPQEAFDRYIADDGPAYVHHYQLSMPEAIDMLHAAGGVAVLAHPYRVRDYADRIAGWVGIGLDGLEVYYPEHDPDFTMKARVLARRHGLVMTGGTDFHRREGGTIRMGTQQVPPEVVEQLYARAERYR
jgi:predicted metal-dependent phosphoesterase TrpH